MSKETVLAAMVFFLLLQGFWPMRWGDSAGEREREEAGKPDRKRDRKICGTGL